jgi:uracil-DNA glycosylase family 4
MTPDDKMERLSVLRMEYEGCERCGLCKPSGRTRANIIYGGNTVDADIMIIGDGPGHAEEENGQPFWPETHVGRMVDSFLKSMHSSREDVWLDNMTMCRATDPDDHERDRPPNKDEIAACKPRLLETIRLVDPKVIILLGKTALKLAKNWSDYEDKETEPIRTGITDVAREPDPRRLVVEVPGVFIPVRIMAYATFSPAYLLRLKEADLKRDNSDMELAWRTWRHAFRVADAANYINEGTIPPQRGVEDV